MTPRESVSAERVLQEVGGTRVDKPPFIQRVGLWLATGVGIIVALVIVGLVVFLCIHHPSPPSSDANPSAEAITQYKEMSGIAVQATKDLFQTVVTQALLPVFTAILGYIFAKGGKADDA